MESLAGRSCIVTGASSGVGLAIARRLAGDGARLVMVARSKDRLDMAARSLARDPRSCLPLAADVTRGEEVRGVVRRTLEAYGSVDVLVNAAGVAYFRPITEATEAQWDQVLDANLKGVFLLCKHVLPHMLAAGRGDIVNIGSIAAHQGFEGATAYCASKHGLLGFSRALALEVRRKGIRVMTVSPGSVDTPLWDSQTWSPDRARMLQPEDVAEAVMASLCVPAGATVDELLLMPRDGVL